MAMRSKKIWERIASGWTLFLPMLALALFASPFAQAQSDPIIQTVRTFSPVLAGTTDVLIDPAATNLDVTVTFTDVNPDPLGSKTLTSFGFQESAMPPGWTFTGNGYSAIPQPTPPAGGNFNIGWFYINVPALPFSFTYRLNSLSVLTDPFDFSGITSYSTDGGGLMSPLDDTQTIWPRPTIVVKRFVPDGPCLPLNVTSLTVQLTIIAIGDMSATSDLGLIEVVPAGWLIVPSSITGANLPENIQINASGNLEVSYTTIPAFPVSFSYQIGIPALESGTKTFSTFAQYRLGAGDVLSGPIRTTDILLDSAPTLIYNGIEPMTIPCGVGESSIISSWTASDIEDGNIDTSIIFGTSAIDFNTPGFYSLNVSVTDSCGNTTSASHTLSVVDNPPTLIYNGIEPMTIPCGVGESSIISSWTASDMEEGNLNSRIIFDTSAIDFTTPGSYPLTVNVSDSCGNTTSASHTISVADNPPTLIYNGIEPMTIPCGVGGSALTTLWTASDLEEGNLDSRIIFDTSAIDFYSTGSYLLNVSVTDSCGNITSAIHTLDVVDTVPTLIYNGINPMTFQCGTGESTGFNYWNAYDMEEGNLKSRIIFDTSVIDFTLLGSYSLYVSVSDSCGNTTSATSTVNVVDTRAPVVSLNITHAMISCGANYPDVGASALDACEGDVTSSITAVSTIPNPATPGCWTVTYTASDSNGNTGSAVLSVYVFDNCPGEGEGGAEGEPITPEPPIHSADQNADNVISLTEMLRVMQFFNLFALHCDGLTEDGFAPGIGDQTCTPHSSDYDPPYWRISLTELLRIIQFFNIGGYRFCPCEGEDRFCPGLT